MGYLIEKGKQQPSGLFGTLTSTDVGLDLIEAIKDDIFANSKDLFLVFLPFGNRITNQGDDDDEENDEGGEEEDDDEGDEDDGDAEDA